MERRTNSQNSVIGTYQPIISESVRHQSSDRRGEAKKLLQIGKVAKKKVQKKESEAERSGRVWIRLRYDVHQTTAFDLLSNGGVLNHDATFAGVSSAAATVDQETTSAA